MTEADDDLKKAQEAIKNSSIIVTLLKTLVTPIGRFVQRRTVSARMGATEDYIDMAYDEIYNEEYEDFMSEADLDRVVSELEFVQDELLKLRNKTHPPASTNLSNLVDARRTEIQAEAAWRLAKAKSSDAKIGKNEHERQARAEAKRAGKHAQEQPKGCSKTAKSLSSKGNKTSSVQESVKSVTMAELEEDVRSVAMAELEAVHLDLTNLCQQVPGMDAEKVLDVIIGLLRDRKAGRPSKKNFHGIIQNCISKGFAKRNPLALTPTPEQSQAALTRLEEGLGAIALAGAALRH